MGSMYMAQLYRNKIFMSVSRIIHMLRYSGSLPSKCHGAIRDINSVSFYGVDDQ